MRAEPIRIGSENGAPSAMSRIRLDGRGVLVRYLQRLVPYVERDSSFAVEGDDLFCAPGARKYSSV